DPSLFKPVAQFDIENDVKGFFPINYQGVLIYMGDNKGLQHSWTDTDVMNGQTYYYAAVSYDRGNAAIGMLPSECTKVIVRDLAGNITLDVNTAEATPGSSVAGYTAPSFKDEIVHVSGFATGTVNVEIIDPNLVKNKDFLLTFDDAAKVDTLLYSFYELTGTDTIPVFTNSTYIKGEDTNPLYDGLRIKVFNDTISYDDKNSKWISGSSNIFFVGTRGQIVPSKRQEGYPVSYEIRVGQPDSSWRKSGSNLVFQTATNFQIWDMYNNQKVKFRFEERNQATRNGEINQDETASIWLKVDVTWREVWFIDFKIPTGETARLPQPNDVAVINIKTPFSVYDNYSFTTVSQKVDAEKAKSDIEKVAVVPNPYVGAARWELQRLTQTGRGERRIYFTHLPKEATIKIYTISGDHVKTLYHNSELLDGQLAWDLTSKEGLEIAPGVYIYHVDAPGVGEKIDKFAIIK
ncbi:MAG: hypothetical protein WC557_05685, partial [Ignavibacteriaceae bacterium]